MPRRSRAAEFASDDEEAGPSQSQRTQTQTQRRPRQSQAEVERPANFDDLVSKMVKAVLSLSVSKVPFKRADLVKLVLNGEAKFFSMVWAEAVEVLKDIWHAEVHELAGKDKFSFIVYSEVPLVTPDQLTAQQQSHAVLLHLILSFIFMKGGKVKDLLVLEFLESLGIGGSEHEFFGDVKKLFEETFVKQLYILRQKETREGSSEVDVYLSWGVRASLEFDKKELFASVCQILNRPSISFIAQYEEAFGAVEEEDIEQLAVQGLGIESEEDSS